MDLRDAISLHQMSKHAEGRSPSTLRLYMLYERKYLEFLDEHRIPAELDALNPLNLRKAIEWHRGQANGKRGGQLSTKMLVEVLKTLASFLTDEGVYQFSPLQRVRRLRVPKILRKPFTRIELAAILGACSTSPMPQRDTALFLLLLDTGMRIGEACTLTLDNLHLAQYQIVVGLEGKSRRERIVPIGDDSRRGGGRTLRALREYLATRPDTPRGGNRVFLGRDKFPLSVHAGAEVIRRMGHAAGVADCHAHRLRHTYATHYLTVHPGDEMGLRRIIGHGSYEVTADYVHMAHSTIAARSGQASIAEDLVAPPRFDNLPSPSAQLHDEPIGKAWAPKPKPKPAARPVEEDPPAPPRRLAPLARFCPACGFERAADARFCAGCGRAMEEPRSNSA